MPGTSEETGHGTKSEKLASLRFASDTRISGRVLTTRLSERLGTDAIPPDAQWSTDGLTDKKWASPLRLRFSFFGRQGRGILHTPHQMSLKRGQMRFLGYVDGTFVRGVRALSFPIRGRMQYAPTLTVDCMGSFCQPSDLDAPSDIPVKGTEVGVGFECHVRFWDCGGGGGGVTGPYFRLRRGGDCHYGRYFELLRGID